MKKFILVLALIAVINIGTEVDSAAIQFIRELLQNNVAGIPLVHKTEIFDFDPDVSIKRREQFYELHGYRAGKLIERLGLGIDGKHKERLLLQQERDEGHLQGSNYLTP